MRLVPSPGDRSLLGCGYGPVGRERGAGGTEGLVQESALRSGADLPLVRRFVLLVAGFDHGCGGQKTLIYSVRVA